MTPVYKSPDKLVAKAIQELLAEHDIQSSVIETKNSSGQLGGAYIKWYELWLRKQSEASRAKMVITQYEFTSFRSKTSTTSRKANSTVNEQNLSESVVNEPVVGAARNETSKTVNAKSNNAAVATFNPTKTASIPALNQAASNAAKATFVDYDDDFEMQQEALDLIKELDLNLPQKRRDDLTPINNKRVFERLGLLLGFSETEINESEHNRLYRPWDSDPLMEKIAALKQKCR